MVAYNPNATYKTLVGDVPCIHNHATVTDALKCGETNASGWFTVIDNENNKVAYGGPIMFRL